MKPISQLRVGFRTDRGRVRPHNQDNYGGPPDLVDPQRIALKGALYVVADGMGGELGGGVASKLAIDTTISQYYGDPDPDVVPSLQRAVQAANHEVHKQVMQNPTLSNMGTTLTAAVFRGDQLIVAHVGDTRAYQIRAGKLKQLTRDHTWVADRVREGTLTTDQARSHPKRSVLSRALGSDAQVSVDVYRSQLVPGDRVLLCSDGLTGLLSDAEILRLVDRGDPQTVANEAVNAANQRGGHDNITAVLVSYEPSTSSGPTPTRGHAEPAAAPGRQALPQGPPTPHTALETVAATGAAAQGVGPPPKRPARSWLPLAGGVVAIGLVAAAAYGTFYFKTRPERSAIAAAEAAAEKRAGEAVSATMTAVAVVIAQSTVDPGTPTPDVDATIVSAQETAKVVARMAAAAEVAATIDAFRKTQEAAANQSAPEPPPTQRPVSAAPTPRAAARTLQLSSPIGNVVWNGMVKMEWQDDTPLTGNQTYDVRVCKGDGCSPVQSATNVKERTYFWCPTVQGWGEGTYRWQVVVIPDNEGSGIAQFIWSGGDCEARQERRGGEGPKPSNRPPPVPVPTG